MEREDSGVSRRPIEHSWSSGLGAPPGEVWSVVSTMRGVNAELRPWIVMTHPRGAGSLDSATVASGSLLFRSWLLLGGVLPFDRHRLVLERVLPGVGFDEESTSWLQRRWRHERRVLPADGGGSIVTDRLVVEPRLALMRPLASVAVAAVFRHRHRRLVARFGSPATG